MDNRETVERICKGVVGLAPMLMFAAICGCESNDIDNGPDLGADAGPDIVSGILSGNGSGQFYSGDFVVTNESDRTIVIDKVNSWENFGEAQPSRGVIASGTGNGASSFFPKLDRFPDSTAVSWVVRGDTVVHSQTISLTGVVPANTEGYTEFIFDSTGVWTVRFVPGAQ